MPDDDSNPTNDGGTPPADPPTGTPPADPPASDPPKDETDWKAESRKWEKLAKDNRNAATELEKLKQQSMSEQEKAVAAAEANGKKAAAAEYGQKLAAAEFRAAVAAAGLDLGEAADLIDTTKFVDDAGEVDAKAIKAAVGKLAKLAPKPGTTRGGADLGGGNNNGGTRRRPSLSGAVAAAYTQST